MSHQLATINFHGHPLTVITAEDGQHLVAMRPVCEGIRLSWHGQYERIKRDEVLQEGVRVIRTVAQDEKNRELVCLPIEYLNGWPFGIDTRRSRGEVRPALLRYKRDCYQVLDAHWQSPPPLMDGFDRNNYVREQLATARFMFYFTQEGRMALQELEPKGIYVHINELPSYLNSKIS